MKLSPRNGVVEMAVVNLPPFHEPTSPRSARGGEPGKHFEVYYDLAKTPPAKQNRPIPRVDGVVSEKSEPEVEWDALHPADRLRSDLLEGLHLGVSRGPYDVILCPM